MAIRCTAILEVIACRSTVLTYHRLTRRRLIVICVCVCSLCLFPTDRVHLITRLSWSSNWVQKSYSIWVLFFNLSCKMFTKLETLIFIYCKVLLELFQLARHILVREVKRGIRVSCRISEMPYIACWFIQYFTLYQ